MFTKANKKEKLKVTVCELRNTKADVAQDWQALVDHVKSESSDLVLLPEMPFYPWVAQTNHVDPSVWQAAVDAHDKWMTRLNELEAPVVIGSRPSKSGFLAVGRLPWSQELIVFLPILAVVLSKILCLAVRIGLSSLKKGMFWD